MSEFHRVLSACLISAAVVACHSAAAPDFVLERRTGILLPESTPPVIVPSEGTVGTAIPVTIKTRGGGCTRQGDTEAHVTGLVADVTPYDSFYVSLPPNTACTLDLRTFTHQASVTFATAGVATVRVHARSEVDGSAIVVERTVQVH